MTSFCGIDFGTSNSTFGSVVDGQAKLLPLEATHLTLPTALFFSFQDDEILYGREAIESYVDGEWGRLMRSLKSILGTPLMEESTQIKTRKYAFTDIIGHFISHMKTNTEQRLKSELTQVVLGRPVHFIDEDPSKDKVAQDTLEKIARSVGFKDVFFQYEPIAAARAYEQNIEKEELVLIIDIGGGTSDFSIVRVSPKNKGDRTKDILANEGIHIGGTDIDKSLSLNSVMPHLGYESLLESGLPTPRHYFHDLATWHKIHFLYEQETLLAIQSIQRRSLTPQKISKLIQVIENRLGHAIAIEVEKAKIALSEITSAPIILDDIQLKLNCTLPDFINSIEQETQGIIQTVEKTLHEASVQKHQIQHIFMTGGTTAIPHVRNSIVDLFPHAAVVDGDRFGSVGLGLALEAQERFS